MDNSTVLVAEHHSATTLALGWIILPVVVGIMLYGAVVLMVWPYARITAIPFWLILLAILIPPFFPFLLFYLFFFFWIFVYPPVTYVTTEMPTSATPRAIIVPRESIRGGSRV